jgi:hypothetical protein
MSVNHTRSGASAVNLASHQVVVDGRPGAALAVASALAGRGRPQALVSTQPPHPALAQRVAGGLELVGEEPVAELRIVGVEVHQLVGDVGVVEVALRARLRSPLVERLWAEPQHPAGQRHRHAVGGEISNQREHHFGAASFAK